MSFGFKKQKTAPRGDDLSTLDIINFYIKKQLNFCQGLVLSTLFIAVYLAVQKVIISNVLTDKKTIKTIFYYVK
jgi:hypothetical protein